MRSSSVVVPGVLGQPPRQPLVREDLRRPTASGKGQWYATRILARAWIRVIYRCWLDGVPYDPATRGAAAATLAKQMTEQNAA